MSFSDLYHKKMASVGSTSRERNFNRAKKEFELYFANSLTKAECVIDGVKTEASFQDQSQSNNKDLSDDKYLVVPNGVEVGIGSYVEWDDAEWLVFTGEYKTVPTHQQFKIKHVNRTIKWLVDKKNKTICNGGKGWGAYVQNQTMYTLGVSFSGDHMPLANAKMSVFIKDTPETRAIEVGTRIFIAGQVYKVEFRDYVSRVGLVNWLLDEDTKNPDTDNFELEIADYYDGRKDGSNSSDTGKKEDTPGEGQESSSEDDKPKVEWNIEGEQRARLGRTYAYTVKSSDGTQPNVSEWIVGDIESQPFYVLEKNEHTISIRIKDDFRNVGHIVTIAAKVNGEIKNIAIKIIKKFG